MNIIEIIPNIIVCRNNNYQSFLHVVIMSIIEHYLHLLLLSVAIPFPHCNVYVISFICGIAHYFLIQIIVALGILCHTPDH